MANRRSGSGVLPWLVVVTLGVAIWLTVDFWRAGTLGAERANILALPIAVIGALATLWALWRHAPDEAALKVLAAAERDACGRALEAMLGVGGIEATIRYTAPRRGELPRQLSGRISQEEPIRSGAHRDLAVDYLGLLDRRLVVVGSSGSGKGLVLNRIMTDMLAIGAGGPDGAERAVPAMVRLAACDLGHEAYLDGTDPETLGERFVAWAAGYLARNHGLPVAVVRSLIADRTLVLCLDGLDEMDSGRLDPIVGTTSTGRPRAAALIRALNARRGLAFVATCRPMDYAEICAQAGGESGAYPLAATHIMLQDLTAPEIVDYLRRRASADDRPGGWQGLIDRLSPPFPDPGLAALLGSPWKLYLTAVTFGGEHADLVSLNAAELDRQLLSSYVPAIVHASPSATAWKWGADEVTVWLESVAANQRQLALNGVGSEREIELANLWRVSASRWPRRLAEVVMSLPLLVPGVVAIVGHHVLSPEHPGWTLLAGIGLTVMSVLLMLSNTSVADVEAVSTDLTVPTVFANRRQLVKIVVGSLIYGCGSAFLSRYFGPQVPLLAGLAIALLTAVGFVLTTVGVGEPRGLGRPSQLKWRCLAHAATDGAFIGLSIGVVATLILDVPTGLGISVGLIAGAIRFLETGRYAGGRAWLRYLVAARISGRRGFLPSHLDRFLDWSVANGLLRMEGGNLRFRHQQLQEFLLDRFDARHPGLRDRLETINLESVHDISGADDSAITRLRRWAPAVAAIAFLPVIIGIAVTASFAPERLPDFLILGYMRQHPILAWILASFLVGSVVVQVVVTWRSRAEDAPLYEPFRISAVNTSDDRRTATSPDAGTPLPGRHILTDLPVRPDLFIERNGPASWADRILAGPSAAGVHALVGPVGVGKTTAAAELARAAHRDGWDRVLWVSGASSWTLFVSLLAVARDLGVDGGGQDAWWVARRVVRLLGTAGGRNLLIIDGTQETLADLLPLRQPNLTVVLTATRYDRPDVLVHRLAPFTRAESLAFLRQRLPEGTATADQLAEALGDNALALTLLTGAVALGAYDDADHYLAARDLAVPPGNPEPDMPPQLNSSVRQHVIQIERRCPFAERIILAVLSALAGERVEIALLQAALSTKGKRNFGENLSRLITAGLVQRTDGGQTVSINDALARAVLDRCVARNGLHRAIAGPASALYDIVPDPERIAPRADAWLLPHVARVWRLTVQVGDRRGGGHFLPFSLSFGAVKGAIDLLVGMGAVRQAAELGTTFVADCGRLFDTSSIEVQRARESLAEAYRSAGDLERLASVQRELLEHYTATLNPYDNRPYAAGKDLAWTYLRRGQPDLAVQMLSSTISSYQRFRSTDRPLIITGLNDLGVALALNHKLDRAGQVLEVALSNAHKHLGSNADLIGEIEANLRAVRGRMVFDADKEAGSASPVGPLRLDAETPIDDTPRIDGLPPLPQADQEKRPPDREVSALIEAADQRYPRRIARPLIELAALLGPGEVPVAVLTSKPCIDHCTRRAGDDVSWQAEDLIDALHELQQAGLIVLDETPSVFRIPDDLRRAVRHVTHDYHQSAAAAAAIMVARAEVPDSHAWALCEAAAWLYHESGSALVEAGVHPVLFHVGRDLTSFGALRAAVAFFNRLLADCLRLLGRDHVDTLTVRWHLVDAQRLGGDEGGAVSAYQRLIRAETNALGAHHDVTLGTRNDLGNLYVRLKHYDAAVDTFDRMCADIEALDGRRSFRMFVLRQAAATCRWLRGDYAEAAALLEGLLADQLYSIGPTDDFTLTTRGLLARCRGDAGDPSGAVAAINELTSALRQRLPVDDEEIQQWRLARAHWLSVAERFGEAVEAYREILSFLLRSGPVDRPEVTDARMRLARMLAHAGDIDGGIRRLEQLLHEQFARRGPHDLLVQTIWRELGSLRGPEYERAVLRRILADQTSVRGEDDDETRSTRDRLDTVERETTTGSD